jgi:hypothetical protein
MNLKKQTLVLALAVITALSIAVSIVSSHNIPDKHSSALSDDHERTITGVWRTVITQRNCQTGEPGASFPGLWTFHAGGTMSNTARKITRSISRSTAMTQAAFLSDRTYIRLPWNSEQAAMSLQRTQQSTFSMPTTT